MDLYPEDLLQALDFDLIRTTISKGCSSDEGKKLALALVPSSITSEVEPELRCTDELLAWLSSDYNLPSTQFEPVLDHARKLRTAGILLEEVQFSHIRSSLRSYQQLTDFFTKHRERFPETQLKLLAVPPLPEVIKAVDQVIDERAMVLSSASKDLGRIRDRLARSRASAARIFNRALKKYREKNLLADFDESISEDRRVLAIQSAYKSRISGIFHSSSNKGNVVFIEPSETVEINNEVAQLIDEERLEIRRILRSLAREIAPHSDGMIAIHHQLAWMDLLKAKAVFAHREECQIPVLNQEKPRIRLKEAYNPALKILNREKGKVTLPMDLELHSDQRLLVISGPNAGGKTIAMKTLGLLALMLQSGIPIPVHAESEMPFFRKILADIGDSQSIQNELSSYSSKLMKMKHFLQVADSHSLLLIDEFGSGSDPELGSALAQVFLERFTEYGVYGIFTTHYNAIKALAAELDGVINGAMLFDRERLTPEYKLEVGNPGSSYTYEVAGQSGIPAHLIEEARKKTSAKTLEVDELLVKLQEDKLRLEKQQKELSDELIKLRQLERDRKKAIQKLESKLDKQSRLNEENDRLLYWGQRFQKLVDSWVNQQGKKDKKQVVGRFIGMLNQRASEEKKETKRNEKKQQQKENRRLARQLKAEVAVGDQVKILETGLKGTITEVRKDRYLITIGNNISSQLSREQFVPVSPKTRPSGAGRKKKGGKG